MSGLYKTEALLLNYNERNERDKLLIFYAKNFGKIGVLGKGVRSAQSKLAPSLALFSRLEIVFVAKKSSSSSEGNGWLLTDAAEADPFLSVKNNDEKFFKAGEFALFLERFIAGQQEDAELWKIILGGFDFLDKQNLNGEDLKNLGLLFKLRILKELGHLDSEEIKIPIFSNEWIFENKEKNFLEEIAKNQKTFKEILDKSERHSQL